jgi:hypothetical protein
MTMTLIETKTLGAAAASIEFTSIPQDFTDLVLVSSCRTARTDAQNDGLKFTFNSVGTDYTSRSLFGGGSGSGGSFTATTFFGGWASTGASTASTFGNSICYIPNYTAAINKSGSTDAVTENNATAANQFIAANLWSNTAAITSVLIESSTSNTLQIGSTISLYGITKGSDGIVTTT